jgi:hypothetical protein
VKLDQAGPVPVKAGGAQKNVMGIAQRDGSFIGLPFTGLDVPLVDNGFAVGDHNVP